MSENVLTQMASPIDRSMPSTKTELVKALNQANMKIQELMETSDKRLELLNISDRRIESAQSLLTKNRVGFGVVGLAAGAVTTYFVTKRLLEGKYFKRADEEIEEMRKHYQAKGVALEAEAAKKPVEEIVRERGYSLPDAQTSSPPMAIQPPAAVVEDAEDDSVMGADEHTPDIEKFAPHTRNVFQDAQIDHEWDWHQERRRRSPDIPYVIHVDEREEMDFQSVTLTYYEGDDVLCNERDEIVDPGGRDDMVGEKNLERFGHGSNDASVVYIRNDRLELIFEVIRSPNNYAEEVQGFTHGTRDRRNLERMRARERDEREE